MNTYHSFDLMLTADEEPEQNQVRVAIYREGDKAQWRTPTIFIRAEDGRL